MKILSDYLSRGNPYDKERATAQKIIEEEASFNDVIAEHVHSHSYIKIERVVAEEPISLHGIPVKASIMNRVSISSDEGKTTLATFLMSESALATMMMTPNTSAKNGEATLESILGERIEQSDRSMSWAEKSMNNIRETVYEPTLGKINSLKDDLEDLNKPLGKQALTDMLRRISRETTVLDEDHYLDTFREVMMEQAAVTRMEASNLVKFSYLLNGPKESMNEGDKDFSSSPMAVRVREKTYAERIVIAKASAWRLVEISKKTELNNYDPLKDRDGEKLRRSLPYDSPEREEVRSLAYLLSRMLRKDDEYAREPSHFVAKITNMSGDIRVHSDSGPAFGDVSSISFMPGREEYRYGTRYVNSDHTPYFEVYMNPVDLVSALRGDPDGEIWTKCTLRVAFGEHIDIIDYEHPLINKMNKRGYTPSYTEQCQNDRIKELHDHVERTSLKSVKDRKEAVSMLYEIAKHAPLANEAAFEQYREACGMVSEAVNDDLREKLEKMVSGKTSQLLMEHMDKLDGVQRITHSPE